MILGQISYVDCIAFLSFLAPQLLLSAGCWQTFSCALQALPFLSVSQIFLIWHMKGQLTVTESWNCHISLSQNGILLESTGVRLLFNRHRHFKTS